MQLDELEVRITGDIKDIDRKLDRLDKDVNGFSKNISGLGGAIAGVFAADQVLSFTKEIIRVRGEFQKFEAVLSNTLGSRGLAKDALDDIREFAAGTPFQVNQLTGAFVKLANQGFVPSMQELTKLGDLASSTGKDFDMLAEAIIDAQVGEFERLKEFGIRAQKEGDRVKFTFKGVQTQVDFTEESIQKYILGLGDAEGVSGSMAAISETLEGKVSNLEDSITNFKDRLGEFVEGPGAAFIDWSISALDGVTQLLDTITRDTTDAILIETSFDTSAQQMLSNIEELNKRLAIVRTNMQGVMLPAEREAAEKQEAELLGLISKQSKELEKQYKLDEERRELAEEKQKQLKEQQEAEKDSKKIAEERAKAEKERLKRLERILEAERMLAGLQFYSPDDDNFDGIDFGIEKEVNRKLQANLGLNDGIDSDAMSLLDEEMDALSKAIDSKVLSSLDNATNANAEFAKSTEYLGATLPSVIALIKQLSGEKGGKGIAKTMLAMFANIISLAPGGGIASKIITAALPMFSTGVNNFSGGMAIVGEKGPELVNLPSGSDVIPNHRMASAMQPVVLETQIRGEDIVLVQSRYQNRQGRIS